MAFDEFDEFDYDELSRNVDDLLDEDIGGTHDEFDELDESVLEDELPDNYFLFRNAANSYGAGYLPTEEPELTSDYDEEAEAMRYDPQTNTGATIRAYNSDYASRAVQRAQRKNGMTVSKHKQSGREGETQRLPRTQQVMMQQQTAQRQAKQRQSQTNPYYTPQRQRGEQQPPRRKEQPPKKKKKHILLKLILFLAILLLILFVALWIFARQPNNESLGEHRDGCAAVLLVGTDVDGDRTDTIMLLYLDEKEREMNLLSIPRDTCVEYDDDVPKINGVYAHFGEGKNGMEALLDHSEQCIGYRPDGYILIDLDCFEELVDLMGGVTFDVPCDMEYEDPNQDLYINLQAGEQKLDGKEAMWVVRFRSGYANADLERIQVQRKFVSEAMKQWLTAKNIIKAPAVTALLTSNTTTNLSIRELTWLAKTAKAIGTKNMHTDTLPGEGAMIKGGAYYVLYPNATANLINEFYNPFYTEVSAEKIYSPVY